MRYYFIGIPLTCSELNFHDRMQIRRSLFLRIKDDMCQIDEEWPQGIDSLGIPGHSPHMKTLACITLLATGVAGDTIDDNARMGKTTLYKYLKRFVRNLVALYKNTYLRRTTQDDIDRLLAENEARGFPGMLRSVDCMHWPWKNCLSSWAKHYASYKTILTIVSEGIAPYDLWFRHAYFGPPGTNNDLNVLNSSPLFDDIFNVSAINFQFRVDGTRYNMGYYLADVIYPKLSTIVESYKRTNTKKEKYFTKMQEAARKDVERAFGILQAKWNIVRGPVEYWDEEDL
ncbi:uncharacterized protein LOC113279299 [Papaver somniferum]|uniref:uncharacterized protein LOC113279299 n=1 Tax=Papaver somniferum TaxID=3469 RepID=UPI000E6F8F31|nr:uncharacterized protein LOC113279299 [Papaver somniferum]